MLHYIQEATKAFGIEAAIVLAVMAIYWHEELMLLLTIYGTLAAYAYFVVTLPWHVAQSLSGLTMLYWLWFCFIGKKQSHHSQANNLEKGQGAKTSPITLAVKAIRFLRLASH